MSIFKNSIVYSLGSVILKGAGFLLMPFYLRIFSKEEYGVLDLGISLAWLLGALFSMGIPQMIFVNYVHLIQRERTKLLLNFTKTYLVLSIITGLIYSLFSMIPAISEMFSTEIKISIFLLSFLTFFQQVYFNLLKIKNKVFKLTVIQTLLGLLMITINIIFVFFFNYRIIVLFLSQVFTLTISLFLFLVFLKKEVNREKLNIFKANNFLGYVKKYISESIVLLGGQISYFLQNQLDKWMVLFFLSISSVGVYSVSTKISALFTLVIALSVISAYTPQLLNRYKVGNVKDVESYSRKRSYMVIVIGLIFTSLCWLLLKTAFLTFVGETYEGAFEPAMILLFSQFLLLALQMRGVFLLYKKKFKTQTLGLTLSLIVNICLNVLLVPNYSIIGAALATSIAYVFSFLFIEYHCLKILKTDY